MEQRTPTIFITPDPPPFPAPPRSVDLSPLEFILALIAVIAIPALIYTFFFSIKCPPSPFRRRQRHISRSNSNISDILSVAGSENPGAHDHQKDQISDVKPYQKEKHAKDIGRECPICLSVFADGEEVKQLSVCKHSFHTSCIDLWLDSHSNCPVCRADIAVNKKPNTTSSSNNNNNNNTGTTTTTRAPPSSRHAMEDLHQGLPDASSLV